MRYMLSRIRQLAILHVCCVLSAACGSRRVQELPHADASSVDPHAGAADAGTVATAIGAWGSLSDGGALQVDTRVAIPEQLRRVMELQAHPPKAEKRQTPEPPDPRVVECTRKATDKATLMSCLDGLKTALVAETPDAGHKLGAVRPPPQSLCPATLVPEWDFSPSGDDSNTCVDPGHPCATFEEVQSRWGCGGGMVTKLQTRASSIGWYVHGDMPSSTKFSMDLLQSGGGYLVINCDTTVQATGTMASVVPKNRHASQALNVDLGAAMPAAIGMQISDTTNGNALAWVDSFVPLGDGGATTVALITQPFVRLGDSENDAFANGHSFSILRPSKIYVQQFSREFSTPTNNFKYPDYGGLQPDITNCWLANSDAPTSLLYASGVDFFQDRIDPSLVYSNIELHNTLVTTCASPGTGDSIIIAGGSITSANAWDTANGWYFGGDTKNTGSWVHGDAMFHGAWTIGAGTTSFGATYMDGLDHRSPGGGFINATVASILDTGGAAPEFYGSGILQVWAHGFFAFFDSATGPATQHTFETGITIRSNPEPNMLAYDWLHDPSLPRWTPINVTNLFTTFSSGGFDGLAIGADGVTSFYNFFWGPGHPGVPTQNPLVWGVPNGGTGLTNPGPAGNVLVSDGGGQWYSGPAPPGGPAGGDLSGTYPNPTVAGLQTHPVSNANPTPGQVLQYNGWDPNSLPGIIDWQDGDKGVTLAGSNVTTWADQSGNSNNWTAAGSLRPTTSTSIGGKGCISFNGTQALTAGNFASGGAKTVVMVRKLNATPGAGTFTSDLSLNTGSAITETLFMNIGGYQPRTFGGDNTGSIGTAAGIANALDTSAHVDFIYYNGGTNTSTGSYLDYLDGTSQTVVASSTVNRSTTDLTALGGRVSSGLAIASGANVDVATLIVVSGSIATGDRNNLCGFLNHKYGVTCAGGTYAGVADWIGTTISGDMTLAAGGAATLASVGTAGSCGDSTHSCSVTFDAKGRETAESNVSISFPSSAVTSVSGSSGVSCSPTTGAVACTNTGVTSVVSGTGITASPSTGAVTVSLNTPVSATLGGTGVASPTAHSTPIAEGASAMTFVAAAAANKLWQAQGTSLDSAWSVWTLAAPGPAGDALISDGTNWGSGYPVVGSKNTQLGHTNKIVKYFRTTTSTANQVAYTYPMPSGSGNMSALTITTVGKDVTTAGNFIAANQITAVYWNNAGTATRFITSSDLTTWNQNGPTPTTNASGLLSIQILISPLTSDTMDWAFYIDAYEN